MVFMNAWAAAAAAQPLAEPLIVEDRAAYLDAHLPADGASEPGLRSSASPSLPAARCIWRRTRQAADTESLLRRRRDRAHARQLRKPDPAVCERRCVRPCFPSADECGSRGGSSHPRDRREYAKSVWPRPDAGRQYHHDAEHRPATRRDCVFDCRTHSPQRGPLRRRTLRHAHQPTVPGRYRRMAGRSLCIHRLQSGPVEPAHHEPERLRRLSHRVRRHLHRPTARC